MDQKTDAAQLATRYLYALPGGDASFFESAGIIYTMAGRPTYYIEGKYVRAFETGKPVFSMKERQLFPFPAGSQPSYYFGN